MLAVGVDVCPDAIRLARRRGAVVLERSIFDRLPGAGRWGCALLLDGNIGIGGRPVPLLRRLGTLLRPAGEVLVELERPGGGLRPIKVRLEHGDAVSAWFDWARVAVDAIDEPASEAGFSVAERWRDGERWFGLLRAQVKPVSTRPPGPFRPEFWRSPLRGPWLTSMLGSLLLPLLLIIAATGFLSHAAYQPDLGRNAGLDRAHDFQPFIFSWPTSPSWLYGLTQGLHFNVGLVAVPFLLAKLWSVIPRLFAWPPVRVQQRRSSAAPCAARRRRAVRVRHRDPQQPDLLPVALQLRARPLLRGMGVRGCSDRAPDGEDSPS